MSETMKSGIVDRLAYASETPDIGALIEEGEKAQQNHLCDLHRIQRAESERYQFRDGKDGSGQLWQKNVNDRSRIVKPWDGCPDPDAALTDEMCENEVDLDLIAMAMGQLGASTSHTTALTAAQSGELLAVARYVQRAIEDDMADDEELLAQMKANLGAAVLNPGWRERWELVEREVDMESFIGQVAQTAGPEAARALQGAVLDPTLEAQAVAALQQLFAYVPAGKVRKIVRDLRESGHATFLDKQQSEKRPTIRTLIPGYNYFVSGGAGSIAKARLHLVVERVYLADLEAMAADNGWNREFVQRVTGTSGLYSAQGEAMRSKYESGELKQEDLSLELWTTSVLQFDEDTGAAGIYCTTFSPHVKPQGETTEADYAHHYLLDFAHRDPPFILARREVTGPGMFDSRSVPDITTSNSQVIRNLQKAGLARAHLEVDPPRAFLGFGGSQIADWNKPGAKVSSIMPGADVKELGPQRGNPQVGEMAINRVEAQTHRLFAFPDAEVHPARWQPRALRKSKRALQPYRQALTQMVVLCYQNFDEYELAEIIGHWPQLKLEDVLQHRITLTFDPRGLDNDWRKETLATLVQLLSIDKGGLMDTGLMIQLIGSYTDPTLMQAIVKDPEGAQAALYRKVMNDIGDIMSGNPPPLVEMDASAGMQLKMAMQIIGQNERWQQQLQQDQVAAENLKTYVKNLQHSEQETTLSPQQGRLGVAQMPQRPVQRGASLESNV